MTYLTKEQTEKLMNAANDLVDLLVSWLDRGELTIEKIRSGVIADKLDNLEVIISDIKTCEEEIKVQPKQKIVAIDKEWIYQIIDQTTDFAKLLIDNHFKRASITSSNLKIEHKCKLIARACMGEGRDWWCGELTEPIKEYPLETHCLHLKTQFKDVVFLCNKADFQQLQLLGRSITGKLDETWVESMLKVINKNE
jgi:hypothetical protein